VAFTMMNVHNLSVRKKHKTLYHLLWGRSIVETKERTT